MNSVVVTGANGFIGSSLINKLVKENVKVVAIDLDFSCSDLPDIENILKLEINLNNVELLMKKIPIDEYDAFYHLAWRGVNGLDKANPSIQLDNEQIAINCALVAKNVNCKKLLCAGTIAEQAVKSLSKLNSTSGGMMYGVAKHCTQLMLEAYCKNIGLNFVWMQFSNIYGPTNRTGNLVSYTIHELKEGKEATFGPALQPYDFIFIEDLIEAIYRLGNNKTKQNMYFIGSGEPRQLKDYLIEIGRTYGREDLIKIGVRPEDGIIYTLDMFDIKDLAKDIGNYVSTSFAEGIEYTIKNY